jgi:hypothetical protein
VYSPANSFLLVDGNESVDIGLFNSPPTEFFEFPQSAASPIGGETLDPLLIPVFIFFGVGIVAGFLYQWKKRLEVQILAMKKEMSP